MIEEHFDSKIRNLDSIYKASSFEKEASSFGQIEKKVKSGSLKGLILFYAQRQSYNITMSAKKEKVLLKESVLNEIKQILETDLMGFKMSIQELNRSNRF